MFTLRAWCTVCNLSGAHLLYIRWDASLLWAEARVQMKTVHVNVPVLRQVLFLCQAV